MKILFFLHHPLPLSIAAWRRTEVFAECFRDSGHNIAIAGAFSPKSLRKAGSSVYKGIRIYNFTPIVSMPNIVALTFNVLSSILTSIVLLIILRPHVIIISVPVGDTALGAFLVGRLFRRKIVIDYRDEWEDYVITGSRSLVSRRAYKTLKNFMTRCYLDSDLVVTVTDALARSLSSRGITNVKIVPNGADLSVFRPYDKLVSRKKIGFNKSDFILAYSGTLGSYYRLDVVFGALEKVIARVGSMKLIIVGEGPSVRTIMHLVRKMNLQNNAFYLGSFIDKYELAQILSSADVGLVPYDANPLWKNSIPAKALEYFACGLPVLATTHKDSALGSLINGNKIGLISAPENVEALACIIEKAYNDVLFCKFAAGKALEVVREQYDRRKIAQEFLSLLSATLWRPVAK